MTDDLPHSENGHAIVLNMLDAKRFGPRKDVRPPPPQRTPSPRPDGHAVAQLPPSPDLDERLVVLRTPSPDPRPEERALVLWPVDAPQQSPTRRYPISVIWFWAIFAVLVAILAAALARFHTGGSATSLANFDRIDELTVALANATTQLRREHGDDALTQALVRNVQACEKMAVYGRTLAEELDTLLPQFTGLIDDGAGMDCAFVPKVAERLQRASRACSSVTESVSCRADNAESLTEHLKTRNDEAGCKHTELGNEQADYIFSRGFSSGDGTIQRKRVRLEAMRISLVETARRTGEAADGLRQEERKWANSCTKLGGIEREALRSGADEGVCVDHQHLLVMKDWLAYVVDEVLVAEDGGSDRP